VHMRVAPDGYALCVQHILSVHVDSLDELRYADLKIQYNISS
jgi:hypothetical protein